MKLIILEGGDQLGKSTLIEGLSKHLNYDNVTIRHFGKPPKGMTFEEVLDFQFKAFNKEMLLYRHIYADSVIDRYKYYPEVMIWNRSHLGEFVYSQMFRNGDPNILKEKLILFEKAFIGHQVYLITLTADPEFFHSKEDGQSFSQKLEDKTKELDLFKEAHEFSILGKKLLLKVDKEVNVSRRGKHTAQFVNEFRPKEDILKEVIQFIE